MNVCMYVLWLGVGLALANTLKQLLQDYEYPRGGGGQEELS